MDFLDMVILVVFASAALGGYRLGFLARAASWIGLGAGLLVGARVLPDVIQNVQGTNPTGRLLVAALVLLGTSFLGQAVGLIIGARLHQSIPHGALRSLDRSVGGIVGLVGVGVAVWMLLPSMASVAGWPAYQTRHSVVARFIDRRFPRPPNTLDALRRLVGDTTFPEVFGGLTPAPNTGVPPVDSGLTAAVQARVIASTVRVSGEACQRIQDGSGFAVAPDLVLTNAHVVAGEHRTQVLLPDGHNLNAVVVAFDPNRDLALLQVSGLDQVPLSLSPVSSRDLVGAQGAVFGHPEGSVPVAIQPSVVRQDVDATGRDLYDSHNTSRDVFILAAGLAPGDSGGALVDQSGLVLGVAFAIAPDRSGTAYALTDQEIRGILAVGRSGPVNTGPCLIE